MTTAPPAPPQHQPEHLAEHRPVEGTLLTYLASAAAAWPDPVRDLSWQDDALCRQTDPEAFFPDKGESPAAAKRVCRSCPVTEPCLAYALAIGERFGVWGGLTERERRVLTKPYRATAGMATVVHLADVVDLDDGEPVAPVEHMGAGELPVGGEAA